MPVLELDDVHLFYRVKGEGIPILFIHPPMLTSDNFYYQTEHLSKRWKVISFDIRGHGRSTFSAKPITYPLIVSDIRHLLDHLGIKKAFIAGYSTGGSIVLEFMLTLAERALGGIVISGMSDPEHWHLDPMIALGTKIAKAKATRFLAWCISWSNSNNRSMFKKLYSTARQGDSRNIEQYYRYSLHYHCTQLLGEIQRPILLVYGQKDKLFQHYAHLLHEKIPSNQLHIIEGAKHQLPTKSAEALNDQIEQFLTTTLGEDHPHSS